MSDQWPPQGGQPQGFPQQPPPQPPQAVPPQPGGYPQHLAVPAAGVAPSAGKRIGAYIIDCLAIFALIVVGMILTTILGKVAGLLAVLGTFATFAAAIAVLPVMLSRSGQTPGKQQMGYKIVDVAGQPPSLGKAVLRSLILGLPVVGIVSAIMALAADDGIGLHDSLIDTRPVLT